MPTGSGPVCRATASRSSSLRRKMRSSPARSRMRWRNCQRQSFHSSLLACGKCRRRKARTRSDCGKPADPLAFLDGGGEDGPRQCGPAGWRLGFRGLALMVHVMLSFRFTPAPRWRRPARADSAESRQLSDIAPASPRFLRAGAAALIRFHGTGQVCDFAVARTSCAGQATNRSGAFRRLLPAAAGFGRPGPCCT